METLGSTRALAFALAANVTSPKQRLVLLVFAASAGSDFEVILTEERLQKSMCMNRAECISEALEMIRTGVLAGVNWDDRNGEKIMSITFPERAGS